MTNTSKKQSNRALNDAISVVKPWWNSDVVVLFRRIAIVFLVLAITRVVFYLYNYDVIGDVAANEIPRLFKGTIIFDSVSFVYAYGLFVILSILPIRLREKSWYRQILFWYFSIITAVVVALNLGDVVYFHYTGIRLTAADFIFAQNENTMSLVLRFMWENWYLFLVWVAIVVLSVWLYKHSGRPKTPIKNIWLYTGFNLAVMCFVILLNIAMVRGGGLSRYIRPVTLSNSMSYAQSVQKGNMILSNPFCILRTISNKGIKYKKYFEPDLLGQVFTPYHYPEKDTLVRVDNSTLVDKKNVVIFVLESFSAEHSGLLNPDLYPDGVGYTPFLDSLMQEGYYFTRGYASGRKSLDALPSILASTPSLKKPFVTIPQGMGEGMQLPKILAEEGYSTIFFCGSPSGSMGFDAYANLTGIKSIYDKNSYDKAYPNNEDYDGWWGIWDEPFIDYMGEVLSQTQQPFFSTTFTLTSHHPFVVPEEYQDILPEGKTKVHKPVAYTDNALRLFFEKYKGEEWFQNTIFIFSGDHVSSERFAEKTETEVGLKHIVLFYYTPDGSFKGKDNSVFQQTDVMPTTLGLLGYNQPYFAFGRDLIREDDREPMAVSYGYDFLIISDSLSMRFDEEKVVSVHLATDTLMQNNIALSEDHYQQKLENKLKAYIQQYYFHLEKKEYLVPKE